MTPDADPRPLAATQGDETAVPASTSVRGGSGAQNGAEGRELHKLRTEHVGVGWARCWIVVCSCGWKARGSTKTRRAAIDWLMPQNCPESNR